MQLNIYNKFAYLYDDLMEDVDYEKWFNYIEDIFKSYNKAPKKILEMACGTGNLSYYLGKSGYMLTCFDFSEDMLSKAYEKLRKLKNVRLIRQDMVNFKFSETFDAVVSVCDSINYITDEKDLLKTFRNVWNHLEDGGIFIFDINSYYKLKDVIGNNTFVEDRENVFYVWENYFDEETNICNFYLTFFVSEDGENFTRFDEEHRERAYKVEDIVNMLIESGFSSVDYYSAFTFDIPDEKTERINFVALK
ncbi:MAG TPA: methyltransferase domain-containing protein [Tissierellaceae bacterium]